MLIINLWQLKTAVFLHWCLIRAVPFKLLLIKIQVVQVKVKGVNERQGVQFSNPVQLSFDRGTTLFHDTQHNDIQHNDTRHNVIEHSNKYITTLSKTFSIMVVSLCWVSLCWMSLISPLCWVSLRWLSSCRMSLCWVSWCHFISIIKYRGHFSQGIKF
jgi:hypothetical protein